jgi:UDP-N-acetylglucosamine 2-epimerase (non-hydrolysing)
MRTSSDAVLIPPCELACVVGTRPNFMKAAPLMAEFRRRARRAVLIHTGQHYSREMSDAFFEDLGLGPADINLAVGPGSATQQIAEIMKRLEPVLMELRPRLVVVVGDVNSTLAAALVAAKLEIPLAHVEAGLRSFDRGMPEEVNRIVTDAMSDLLFATEQSAVDNLLAEGVPREKIHFAGNVMIDSLLRCREAARSSNVLERLGVTARGYALATLHRPSNVDSPERLSALIGVLRCLSKELPVVFPVHPRTSEQIRRAQADCGGVITTEPMGYVDFVRLIKDARLVLTDSGGIQEETTILNVPCLTLRLNTERPITLTQGTNRLAGVDPAAILEAARSALAQPVRSKKTRPRLWDGQAGRRVAAVIERFLADSSGTSSGHIAGSSPSLACRAHGTDAQPATGTGWARRPTRSGRNLPGITVSQA